MQFTLRTVTNADEEFLYRLYQATHGQQFTLLPLAREQREALVRMQFNAQRSGYRQQYPASQDFVIEVDGESAGRVWLDESGGWELHLVDIAVLPNYQGRGLGAAVLRQILKKASASSKRARLHVARINVRAFDFYRRLGFEVKGGDEVYIEMQATGGPPRP